MKNIETETKTEGGRIAQRHFRRLKWNERVVSGDFIKNKIRGFELWEGPNGFRADTFVEPIYRRKKHPAARAHARA